MKFFKNKSILLTLGLTMTMLFSTVLGTYVKAENSAGTANDPLVTKSYVDKQIQELSKIFEKYSTTPPTDTSSTTFQVVEVASNQKIIGVEGTEIILRAGSASCYSEGIDGVSDITNGENIDHGTTIQENHHLIIPRTDRRGVLANSHAYFLVKGTYTIEN